MLRMIADYYNTTVNDYGNIHFQLTKYFIIFLAVKFEESDKDMWDYVYELTRSIEIRYVKDEKEMLTRVYFRFDSSVRSLLIEIFTLQKRAVTFSL